jgi:para-nitrobenzyl esterase
MDEIVQTQHGKLRGSVADGIYTFKGIPYAAPPFGANRLRPAQPVVTWSGVKDALTYGPTPPKPPIPPQVTMMLPELTIPGEDCLNLNIWSPDLAPAARPVMVWIPGGMFEYGTAATAWYDGSRFARDGIVCVTINYRVGAEGFLYLGSGNANRGLLDQVAALEWVQENIATFGGDPNNVTIFGESAGALSVGTLLSMPCAEGLFHRAIAQSGAAQHVSSVATAERVGRHLAERLGVKATREAVAAVPLDRLLQAQEELKADLVANPDPKRWGAEVVTTLLPWQPVVDGAVIPAPPLDRVAAVACARVGLMAGFNSDEHRLFLVPDVIDHITYEALAAAIAAYGLLRSALSPL